MKFPKYSRVFSSWRDGLIYARAISSLAPDSNDTAKQVCVKLLRGTTLKCRGGTSDPWVLWDVFYHQFQQLPPEIRSPLCIVDLGANVGYTAAYYATAYPRARIVAVEMDRANYELACQNAQSFGDRCEVINAAIWNSDCDLEYSGREHQGYRLVKVGDTPLQGIRQSVKARSLTSLLDELRVISVDFLKMDIEGAEAAVLRGPLDWLKKVRALKIEVHAPMQLNECADILTSNGFTCRKDDQHQRCLVAIRTGL